MNPYQGQPEGNQGEGNKEADRRYREGVRRTVENTSEEERAQRARNMTPQEIREGSDAEAKGKSRGRD